MMQFLVLSQLVLVESQVTVVESVVAGVSVVPLPQDVRVAIKATMASFFMFFLFLFYFLFI